MRAALLVGLVVASVALVVWLLRPKVCRELDSNPPRLWTYIFWLTSGAAIWLFVAYPAIPWFSGPTAGVFEWSSRADLAA